MGNYSGSIHIQKEMEVGQEAVGTQIKMYIIKAEIWIGRKVENSRQESTSKFGFRIQYSQLCKPVFKSSPQDEGYCLRSSSNSLYVVQTLKLYLQDYHYPLASKNAEVESCEIRAMPQNCKHLQNQHQIKINIACSKG